MRSTSTWTMFRCEKEVFTRGKLDASEHGVWPEVVGEQENSNVHRLVVQRKHHSGEVEQALAGEATDYFRFGILFLFSFSDTCVSRLCAAAGSFSHPLFTVLAVAKEPILQGATSWLGRYPRFARLLLQVSFVAYCKLIGSSVSFWQQCHCSVVCFDCE